MASFSSCEFWRSCSDTFSSFPSSSVFSLRFLSYQVLELNLDKGILEPFRFLRRIVTSSLLLVAVSEKKEDGNRSERGKVVLWQIVVFFLCQIVVIGIIREKEAQGLVYFDDHIIKRWTSAGLGLPAFDNQLSLK